MVGHEITVIIPTIAPHGGRDRMLAQALQSVEKQTLAAKEVIVEHDTDREGPAIVRNRAVEKAKTEWIAFLDDDDYFFPEHLETLAQTQADTAADLVWPWFRTNGHDPFPQFFGRQWDPKDPHQIPITFLLRTEAFRAVGGFVAGGDVDPNGRPIGGEDWRLTLALSSAGYRFSHVKERTWYWRHHGKNTSGLPSRW